MILDAFLKGKSKALAADRFWSSRIESMIAGDDEGQCKGIELRIWERAKVLFWHGTTKCLMKTAKIKHSA